VYIIELPAPVSAAPIDFNAVGRWIERVPTLTVDGATPTGRDLAARLHGVWVADQTVLYIGLSGASIGARVGAFVRTPLGDRRPYAGGYWLKTLTGLDKLRVWWAETDATEEYEDALFGAFAAAVPAATAARLHDPTSCSRSPTSDRRQGPQAPRHRRRVAARRRGPTGQRRDRRAAAAAAQSGGSASGSSARGPRSARAARRRRPPAVGRRPQERHPPPAPDARGRRPGDQEQGAESTDPAVGGRARASGPSSRKLTTVTRPAIVARIVPPASSALKENSDYHEARREQSFAEGRIQAIEDLLRNVELIEDGVRGGRARLGSTVVVEGPHGDEETYTLVGSTEANPASGRISGHLADRRRADRCRGRRRGRGGDPDRPSG
jgi:transcription elongation GreA/GreB family factor